MPETDKYRLYRQKRLFYSMKQLVHFGNSHNLSRNELVLFMEHATMLMNVSSWEVTFYFTKLAEHHKNEDMKPEQIHLYTDKIKLWDGIFLILEYIQQNQKKIETILRNYINEDLQKGENVFDNLFIDDLLNKIMYKNRFSMEHVIPEINLLFEHNYWLSLINLLYNMTSFTKYFTSPTLCPKITEFCSMDPLVFEHFPIYMRLVEIFSPFDHTLKQDKSSSQYNKIVGIFHDLCLNPYFIGTKNFYTPPLRIAFLHKKLGQVKKPNELSEEIKSIQTIRTFMEVANLFFRNSYEKQILLQKVAFSTLSSHLHAWCNNFNSLNRKKKQEIDLPASLYYFIRHWTSYHYELYVQSSVSVKEAVKMAIYQNSTDSNSNGEGNKVIRVIYHYKSYINSLINSDLHELEYCPSLKSFKSEEKLHSFLNYQNLYDLSKLVGPEGMCMISKTVNEEVKREIQQLFNLYIYIAKIAKRKNQNILNFDHIKDLPGNIELIPLIRTFAQIGNLLFLMEIIKSVVQTFIQNEKPCLFIKLKNHIGQRKTSGSDVISSSSTSNRLSGSNSPTNSPKERNLSRESNSNEESSSSKESNVSEKPNSTLSYEEKIMDLLDENSKIIFENSDELQFAKKVCMFIPLLIFNAVENDTEVQEDGQKGDNLFKKTLKKDNKTKDNSHIIIKNQMNSIIRGIDETISLIRKHCIPSQDNEYEIDKIWKFYNYVIQQYIISSQRKNEFAIKFIQTSTLFSQNYYAGALKNDNFPGRISQQHVIPDSLILDVYD
ncbi:hypothetical protein TRFO_25458 [Tritrichomonas foetus]|uniref:Uncharacterized protein n=1 Tax=Tritrichomonas foetus TaxID=1144522 RepID=A0A1J4K6J1_9EUKA|nr:hypothetical protein TRFO_25458 [Tritrichomonas foetus]|eukprot:OHT06504.1 hypothetical protein TRFO_25458 [Tritrichomonas foetus]